MNKHSFLVLVFIFFSSVPFAQTFDINKVENNSLKRQIDLISKDKFVTIDSAWRILTAWKQFPDIAKTNCNYLFIFKDSVFGDVPFNVFIPKDYKSSIASPLILLLHGATGQDNFENAYKKDTTRDDDIFFNYLSAKNFIIVRPFSDAAKKFDWVVNRFNTFNNSYNINSTYNTLTNALTRLKGLLNINDNKIFAYGHSDGSDGAFALEVYKPTQFAGFVGYNSMLTNLFAYDIYLRNTVNRPLYLVHSDLDDLRPIEQTRAFIKIFDSLKSPVQYKEYFGYEHYDKHLQKDIPFSEKWINSTSRNPFQQSISWETDDYSTNSCDWIKILVFDTSMESAPWQVILNPNGYDKKLKKFRNSPYYYKINKSAAVKAFYNNNVFNIETSRTKEIELLISPLMVNIAKPVQVKINGKLVFNNKVLPVKSFLINNFKNNFDRIALWVAVLKLEVE